MLFNLLVSCGGKILTNSSIGAGRNASYTSTDAVKYIFKAISVWVDELLMRQLLAAPFFSLMVNECTDIISYVCTVMQWIENGPPVEHLMADATLNKAESHIPFIVDCLA